jgi:uncharacterized protein YwqG
VLAKHRTSLPTKKIEKQVRPSLRVKTHRVPMKDIALGASRLGGVPDLPGGTAWPRWAGSQREDYVLPNGERHPQTIPPTSLAFMAELELARLPPTDGLPRTGWLLFFYDAQHQPWGFDPRDRGSSVVIYVPAESPLQRADTPRDLSSEAVGEPCAVDFALEATLPDTLPELEHNEFGAEEYAKVLAEIGGGKEGEPQHRVLGWPQPIQNEMTLEVQLVTHGLYTGDGTGFESPRAAALKPGAADWILLLQIDSDDKGPGWMWGDDGRIYFWIRKQDLQERRFDNIWTILQCG